MRFLLIQAFISPLEAHFSVICLHIVAVFRDKLSGEIIHRRWHLFVGSVFNPVRLV